jgi:hypothetical protein
MTKKEHTIIELMHNLGKLTMINRTTGFYDISDYILRDTDIELFRKYIKLSLWQIRKVGNSVRFYVDLEVKI